MSTNTVPIRKANSRGAIEDILEDRSKGPFVPVPDDLVEQVMVRALERMKTRALEDVLEERDKGPFIPLPRDWKEQVMTKAKAQVNAVSSSASAHA
jgi:hypothetical protein